MANAEIAQPKIATPPSDSIWWRRWHSYAFAAVIGLQIGVGPFLAGILDDLNLTFVPEVVFGVAFAQCFLLGMWGALGGQRVLPRWGAVGLVYLVGVVALTSSVTDLPRQRFWLNCLALGLIGMTFVAGCAVALLPLRSLVGWRIDFDLASHRDARLRRGQVAILDFAGYTCAVAGLLMVVRLILELSGDKSADAMAWLITAVAFAGASAGIPAYAVLTRKWLWVAILAAGLWAVAVLHVHTWLSPAYWKVHLIGGGPLIGPTHVDAGLLAFHGAIAATVVIPLAILRLCGLKLLVVQAGCD